MFKNVALYSNNFLTYEYGCGCIACGHNVIKRNNELKKISRKETNFNIRLKYAQHKVFAFVEVYINYMKVNISKKNFFEVLADLKKMEN